MATKTISITEDAYERLAALREKNESFSEIIERLTGKVDITKFAGILVAEEADKLENDIAALRRRTTKRMGSRIPQSRLIPQKA